MKFRGILVDMVIEINPEICKAYAVSVGKNKVLYVVSIMWCDPIVLQEALEGFRRNWF
jgi:hypothetical protein